MLAAGSGDRFGGRKQLARVGARRCLDLAVEATTAWCGTVVVALPEDAPLEREGVITVRGGQTRAQSVRNALAAVPSSIDVIVVHDAAHPVAPAALFGRVIEAVWAGADAAVPIIPPAEAVKQVAGGKVLATVPRGSVGLVQMPQAFRASILRSCHRTAPEVVEDSELVERMGGTVRCVAGDPNNIHVVTPDDLEVARVFLGR